MSNYEMSKFRVELLRCIWMQIVCETNDTKKKDVYYKNIDYEIRCDLHQLFATL